MAAIGAAAHVASELIPARAPRWSEIRNTDVPLLTSIAALVGMAAPAHTDSDNDDHAFLATLTKAAITDRSPTAR